MSNADGTPTHIEELALVLYGQLEAGDWKHSNLELIEEALRAARASGLEWSTNKPTQPGWYWYKPKPEHGDVCIARIIHTSEGGLIIQFDNGHCTHFAGVPQSLIDHWAGPLVPPTA